jgi:Peptidase family M48
MRTYRWVITAFLLFPLSTSAQHTPSSTLLPPTSPASHQTPPSAALPGPALSPTMDKVVDRALEREHALMKMLQTRTPFVETYVQDLKFRPQEGPAPVEDHYFLGRMDLSESMSRRDYLAKDSFESRLLGGFTRLFSFQYKPLGFSWMIYADRDKFDRQTYDFQYAGREFLGDVRCIVFEVSAKKGTGRGRFHGRIWVEDQDYNIVRLNGTYEPGPRNAYFFHMDSWRLNLVPGYWVPAYVYSEEGDFSSSSKDKSKDKRAFKAQTRLWGYEQQNRAPDSELTEVRVDSTVKDESAGSQDASPVEAQWHWQQQAGDNVIKKLEKAGLLAPEGDVDKVLETVVNNLLVSNKIELPGPVRARVMLTSPLETFSVGNTIVVSRGLVDVLPDEASLAMVLSRELAHILLGHNLGSKYAFNDRLLFSDESVYRNLGFRHFPEEEDAADKKALELLKSSPYADKLYAPGLFLRQLQVRGRALSALLTPHLGTGFTDRSGDVDRMVALLDAAPALVPDKPDQIAALPLGGRVKLNPWDNRVELIKTTPVAVTSGRGKMPLEVTPFFPRLTRYGAVVSPTASVNAANPIPSNE